MSISLPGDVRRERRGVASRALGLETGISDPTERGDGDEENDNEDEPCVDINIGILSSREEIKL